MENIQLFLKQLDTSAEKTAARIMFNKSMTISIAESCTGGLISSRLTDIAGSSVYTKENYITYSNEAKIKLLGVREETLKTFGSVSEECAREMAEGLFERTDCDIALVTTGIAGPGGTDLNLGEKSAGLIYIAIKNKYTTQVKRLQLNPHHKRKLMKFLFSQHALEFLIEFLKETHS